MNLSDIEILNNTAMAKRDAMKRDNLLESDQSASFQQIKHTIPYYGFVECSVSDQTFLMFSANDDVVAWEYFWLGCYEEPVVNEWVRLTCNADLVLDIGAYTGCMSLIACLVCSNCDVYAFEAMPRTVERLSVNVKANGFSQRVHIEPFAISNQQAKVELLMPRPRDFLGTGNSVFDKPNITMVDSTFSESRTIDSYLPKFEGRTVSCIKLDIEGHEMEALHGMDQTISINRPPMIVEVWQHEHQDIMEFFSRHSYRPTQLKGKNWLFEPK